MDITVMNIRKDLKGLFKEYIINKSKPKPYTPSYGGNSGGSYRGPILFNNGVKIYFYEFSNIYTAPRAFYTIDAFNTFLSSCCKIYLQLYQKEIINNLGEVFISCYKGKSELCIRSSWKSLCDAMNAYNDKKEGSNGTMPRSTGQCLVPINHHKAPYDGHWYG